MGKVLFGLSVSLDGFIADKNDGVSEVFAWMGSAMEHFFEVAGEQLNETGAVIMGHRSFDQIYSEQGWVMPDGTPIPGPVSKRARRREKCGIAWCKLGPTSLEGGAARRIAYEHCPCAPG